MPPEENSAVVCKRCNFIAVVHAVSLTARTIDYDKGRFLISCKEMKRPHPNGFKEVAENCPFLMAAIDRAGRYALAIHRKVAKT